MAKEEQVAIEPEPEAAVVVDRADPRSKGQSRVGARNEGLAVSLGETGKVSSVVEVAGDELLGEGPDEGVGGIRALGEVASGVEKDGVGKMAQLIKNLDR
ncbi:hypothetical protein GCM10007100_29900 [Roseibacillus persicicus]|uniref:Uncharacterized protein n=1 Tax=Roseibacillus persicicus TaxID=454148 RepID=A0A918WNX3_9BACT|nr:hypothetical protein GCM10007100_29900 [Roseibacillus persicicus]